MKTASIDWSNPKYIDPMEEIYAIRREISEECGHSVHRLIEMMREKLKADEANGIKHEYARLPIARVAPAMA